jgi:twitching motility protein PilT
MLQVGRKHGMQTLDDGIMDLLNKKMISPEDAYSRCLDKAKFKSFLKNPPDDWQ